MSTLQGKAIIGQSGGPTAAINATLAGVIAGCFASKSAGTGITGVLGMKNGIEGFMQENIVDLYAFFKTYYGEDLDERKIESLKNTPAAALGSCRKKLPAPADDPAFYEALIELFKKYEIRYFFYIGGNDSMDTVAKLTEYLKTSDYEMRVMGVPKTIDNDLDGTDHTPGFGSAAKYIATTVQEIVRDCSVYTTPAVTIVEIMGRDAGWLTASAALPYAINGSVVDYVYLPEVPFSLENFFEDIENALKDHPNVVVAVSEGARYEDGRYVGEGTQSGASDVFGHKYLSGTGKALELAVKEKFGCKVRSIELNLPQRCAAHLASKTDIEESFTTGKEAANAAVNGTTGAMMTISRSGGRRYNVSYEAKDVCEIANRVKCVPRDYINDRGNNVTRACLDYMKPLIVGETTPEYEGGLPVHIII